MPEGVACMAEDGSDGKSKGTYLLGLPFVEKRTTIEERIQREHSLRWNYNKVPRHPRTRDSAHTHIHYTHTHAPVMAEKQDDGAAGPGNTRAREDLVGFISRSMPTILATPHILRRGSRAGP